MRHTCEFPAFALSVVDHRIMNIIDTRLRRTRSRVSDPVDRSRPGPSFSLIVGAVLGVARWTLVAAGGWTRELGSSIQFGPDPEQVTGRATGART